MEGFVPIVAGSQVSDTQDTILAQELEKLHAEKLRLKEENSSYLSRHPELQSLLDEFATEILTHKPNDLVRFGQHFFNEKVKHAPQKIQPSGPPPLVIAGPSGVGKGTIISQLMEKYPSFFGFSVSHTTRGPRPGEANGIQYNFVTIDEMKQAIQEGKFIEHAQVHTNYYGTSYAAVERIQSSGKICILDIDIQGVQNVKKSQLDCYYLFISPPSLEELQSRLRGRGTETEEKIQIRTNNAKKELEYGLQEGNFNAVIVNDTVENAIIRALSYIEQWYGEYGFRIHDEDLPRSEGKRAEGKDDDEEEEEEEK